MKTTTLYPGMCDDSLEIFYHPEEKKLKAIFNSRIMDYAELPNSETEFLEEIIEDEAMTRTILNSWFPGNLKKQKEQLAKCRFGGLNFSPDRESGSGNLSADLFDCPYKDTCVGRGIVCNNVKYQNHELSEKEVRFISLMSTEECNKSIAEKLEMPEGTFQVFRTKFYEKLNVKTKQELTRVGVFLGIA